MFIVSYFDSVYENRVVRYSSFYYGNVVFAYLKDGSVISVVNPGIDSKVNNQNMLNPLMTRSLFNKPESYGLRGLSIDEKNRFFLNDNLVTRFYNSFYEYWDERHKRIESKKDVKASFVKYARQFLSDGVPTEFVGRDIRENSYWQRNNGIIVFDGEGWPIDLFFPKNESSVKTTFSVHPSGDVYFIDYDKNGVYLYRIANVWDLEVREKWEASLSSSTNAATQYATSTESRVRVRGAANLQGETLGYLEKGDRVEVLEQSGQKKRIGEMEDYWYRVRRLSDGLTGWAYGYFLKLEQ
jgi:hypothetical protein